MYRFKLRVMDICLILMALYTAMRRKKFEKLFKREKQTAMLITGHRHFLLHRQLLLLIGPERLTSSRREREARCTSTGREEGKGK